MCTPATREQHSRDELRYSTDLTDAEWDVIAPHLLRRWSGLMALEFVRN